MDKISGLTYSQLHKEIKREKLSHYLPYLFQLEENQEFLLSDNTSGYLWELYPKSMPDNDTIRKLTSLLKTDVSRGSIMQFIFFADPSVDTQIDEFSRRKTRKNPVLQRTIEEHANYLKECSKGIPKLYNIPLRNYRLFLAFKSPEEVDENMISNMEEKLSSANFGPRRMAIEDLALLMRRLFNGLNEKTSSVVDKRKPLASQIIKSSSEIKFSNNGTGEIELGANSYARVITPTSLPKVFDPIKQNRLCGGFMGLEDDTNQAMSPFIYSLNIIYGSATEEINKKASFIMSQRVTGRIAKKIGKMAEEYNWASEKLAEKEEFVSVIPSIVVFSESSSKLRECCARISRLWQDFEFVMQNETRLSRIMFLSSLPFGFFNMGDNLETIERHFPMPLTSAVRMIPFTGDYRGAENPVMVLQGRKGQIINIDIFDNRSNNHNLMIAAESGSGKSFFTNYMMETYYSEGQKIRLLDIGYSYLKQSMIFGGRFIDYGAAKNVVTNPFFCATDDEEDIMHAKQTCTQIIAQMAYSASDANLDETEWTLIKMAVAHANQTGNIINGIDAVRDYLRNFKHYAADEVGYYPEALTYAQKLAFNLRDFCSDGDYGHFFNGQNTFDISSDQHVVIELDKIKGNPELMSVCILQMLNSITQDLYLSSDTEKSFILFDEFKTAIKDNEKSDGNRVGAVFEEGYRRARKYGGSFGVILQAISDLKDLGSLGDVMNTNSVYKFYLQGSEYSALFDDPETQKYVTKLRGFDRDILPTLINNKPRYSEVFIQSPLGNGVGRLSVGDWMFQVNNSEKENRDLYMALTAKGLTPLQALAQMSGVKL